MERKYKSQLADDLSHALFVCRLRDELSVLVDDPSITDKRIKEAMYSSYIRATVLLVCAVQDSSLIRAAMGQAQ